LNKKLVALLAALFIISNLVTYRVAGTDRKALAPPAMPSAREKAYREELAPLLEVLEILSERYLEEVSREELLNAAIQGMIDKLGDPQTSFLDREHWEEMKIKTTGSFSGIGVEITSSENYITVIAPIKGTPGERAGILAGDRILEVDGKDLSGFSTMDAVKLIRGPEGTKVTLKIQRDGVAEPFTLEIVRGNIQMPSVFPEMLKNNIGYLQVTTFAEQTGEDFAKALLELENQGLEGLLLDLRDNPGGLLDEAIEVAQGLLPAGAITHVVDRDDKIINTYKSYGVAKPYPIVLLVNGGTASAAEILAGAFQDSGAGVLVGTKTYGKATVQHLEDLPGNSGLRYTVAEYRTPAGRDINAVGLEPNVVVELPDLFFAGHHPLTTDLKPGDENPQVLFLQKILNKLGFKTDESSVFDSATERAVRAFQAGRNLPADGLVNYKTRKKLQEELDRLLEQADTQKQKAVEMLLEKIRNR
jgi:carboxyl-terminal processing protease